MAHFPVIYTGSKKLGQVQKNWARFKTCVCGLVGDADHYLFRCPLTVEFRLIEPSDGHRKRWFKNLSYNGQAQSKLIQAFKISNGICDRLT
ncbi:hypothetical protein AVEN_238301-1 [Araneus ventricosus]|uniref:Reverse transcriptase zinc-binding domain-containing protein n=1 Tax=Araneus ventricosus TaxID=182803 RepID=A0A4Y2KGK9_ARAVE|nr:hypothetical protein AVEN_238301-1 [Araneus ventricosus]